MKCLQCNKPANEVAILDGTVIGECEDGHRTGKLSVDQDKALSLKLGLDSSGPVIASKVKGRKTVKRSSAATTTSRGSVLADVSNGG